MRSTSSGQTSTQTVQPLSAMHFASSTTTGTAVEVVASGMKRFPSVCLLPPRLRGGRGGVLFGSARSPPALPEVGEGKCSTRRADALLVVEALLLVGDRDDVGI